MTTLVHEAKIDPNFAIVSAVRLRLSPPTRFPYRIDFSGMTRNSSQSQAGSQTSSPPLVSVNGVLALGQQGYTDDLCSLFSRRARILEKARGDTRGGST